MKIIKIISSALATTTKLGYSTLDVDLGGRERKMPNKHQAMRSL
jgi:hypothetical protein